MAQLDRLLSVMVTNRADAILLLENDVAKMVLQGETRPLTRAPSASVTITPSFVRPGPTMPARTDPCACAGCVA